jgi:D-alanyl-D-alanine carboxypeptidase
VRFVDGSGLSRHNLAPPRAFVALFLSALEGAAREDAADGPAFPTPNAGTDRSARNPFAAFLDALPETARDGANGVRSSETAVETSVERVEDRKDRKDRKDRETRASGTLGARLGDLRGVVRAKTGSMRGAAALSGYFAPHACSRLGAVAFSVVANNHASAAPDAAHRLRDALDEIVRLIDRAEVVREEGERP